MMKIFKLYNLNRNNKTILYEGTPLMKIIGCEDWGDYNKIEKYIYTWDSYSKDKPVCDSPFLIGSIPIFRNKIIQQIKIQPGQIDLIPITIEKELFEIIKAKTLVNNVLNKHKSKISYFSDGRIMDINKYVFKPQDNWPEIFKIAEFPIFTFVNENIAEQLNRQKPSGLGMEECAIKKGFF